MSGDSSAAYGPSIEQVNDSPETSTEAPGVQPEGRDLRQVALEEIVWPVAIAGMLTCIVISLGQLLASLRVEWPGRFMAVFTFLVSLESIQAQRLLMRRRMETQERLRFHFVEWVIILLVLRFGVYLSYGGARLIDDLATWALNVGAFFGGGFVLHGFLAAVFWALARDLAQTMRELEASPMEEMPSVTDPNHYLRSTMPRHGGIDRQARLDRIVTIFFWGGAALLFLAGLSRVDVRDLVVLQHSRSSGIILNALVYFVVGFVLVSQAQYTILKARWDIQRIPILGGLGSHWVVSVLVFLLLVGSLAALLPVSYSVGILDALSTVLRWIVYGAMQIVFFVLFIISYVFGWLMSLFGGKSPAETPTMQQATPPAPPVGAAEQAPIPWWPFVRSLIFWAILVGVVGYSLVQFARDRWGLFQGLSWTRFLAFLRNLWRRFHAGTRRIAKGLRQGIAQRLALRRSQPSVRRWRYVSLRRLTPRERVRYFYVSVLRRSAEGGFGRPPSKTPLEYEAALARELSSPAEVRELTGAFLEARYSEHHIDQDDARVVQRVWRSVKRAVTRRRRGRAQ